MSTQVTQEGRVDENVEERKKSENQQNSVSSSDFFTIYSEEMTYSAMSSEAESGS